MEAERTGELALTVEEWRLRRNGVSLRAARRVFVRVMAARKPGEKKYRDEWDRLFEEFRRVT